MSCENLSPPYREQDSSEGRGVRRTVKDGFVDTATAAITRCRKSARSAPLLTPRGTAELLVPAVEQAPAQA